MLINLLKYWALFAPKLKEELAIYCICCSWDWRFMGWHRVVNSALFHVPTWDQHAVQVVSLKKIASRICGEKRGLEKLVFMAIWDSMAYHFTKITFNFQQMTFSNFIAVLATW